MALCVSGCSSAGLSINNFYIWSIWCPFNVIPRQVLEKIFVNSTVLVCSIHVLQYFLEQVFTGKAYCGDAGDKNYLCGADKDDLISFNFQNPNSAGTSKRYSGCIYGFSCHQNKYLNYFLSRLQILKLGTPQVVNIEIGVTTQVVNNSTLK